MTRWNFAYPSKLFPFTDSAQTDPISGERDGLLADIPANLMPRIFHTNSSNEYWRGTGALIHVTPDGRRDVEPPENVRIYMFAGAQHAPGISWYRGQLASNPNNFVWFQRALLSRMNEWLTDETSPPDSRYPAIAAGTLVPFGEWKFPALPSVSVPTHIDAARGLDFGPRFQSLGIIDREPPQARGEPYPVLVPSVNEDGNEVSGLLTPELAVPLATYTGWRLFHPSVGPSDGLILNQGSYIPFPASVSERESADDPRWSIEERYGDRSEFLGLVAEYATTLIAEGYLLAEDLSAIVQDAGDHWDRLVSTVD